MKPTLKHTFAAILLVLSFATPVAAGPLEDAEAAYARGDYATYLRLIRRLAGQGHVAAQYNLGVMYDKGQGVPQDYAEAVKWYRKAADQGHVDAQYNLGVMYEDGQGVPQDYAEAVKWYRLAANQGSAAAQRNLRASPAAKAPQSNAAVHLVSFKCSYAYGFMTVDGEIRNISNSPLSNLMVVASNYASDGTFIQSDSGMLEYNPLMPGQTSRFKVMGTYNPMMSTCKVGFKRMFGGAVEAVR